MSFKPAKIIRVSIHGNIGVGKSTLIANAVRLFARNPSIRVVAVLEPTDAWVNSGALRVVISNPARWGVSVQYTMMNTRCTNAAMKEEDVVQPVAESGAVETVVVLYERSLVDDREIFARHAITDPEDWRLYEELVARINSDEFASIKRMIYLRNSCTVCMKHIKTRGRDGEDGYNLAWIEELENRHELMIEKAKKASNESAQAPDVVTYEYTDGMDKDDEFVRKLINDVVADFAAAC